MADNVPITAGSGTTIATDDVSGVHYQRVKLVDGTLDATGAIGGDATNGLDVDVTRVQGSVTTVNAGDIAHDAADSGNPVKVGGKARDSLDDITLVAENDRTDLYCDVDGVAIQKLYCPLNNILSERVTITSGTSTALSTFGATANVRNHITTIIVYNDTTTNDFVDIRDGTAGSVLATIPLPAKGGAVVNFPIPLRQPTANTALAYDVNTGGSTIYLTFVGFKSKA